MIFTQRSDAPPASQACVLLEALVFRTGSGLLLYPECRVYVKLSAPLASPDVSIAGVYLAPRSGCWGGRTSRQEALPPDLFNDFWAERQAEIAELKAGPAAGRSADDQQGKSLSPLP